MSERDKPKDRTPEREKDENSDEERNKRAQRAPQTTNVQSAGVAEQSVHPAAPVHNPTPDPSVSPDDSKENASSTNAGDPEYLKEGKRKRGGPPGSDTVVVGE